MTYTAVPELPMMYTLSKIFVGGITGSSGRLGRGASQKKCPSPAHMGPPAFLAFSMSAFTSGESGLVGAASGGCASSNPGRAIARNAATMFLGLIITILSCGRAQPESSGHLEYYIYRYG